MFDWTVNSWIIVLIAFLTALSSSVLGVFLILRKMSLVADAISHAVLPGIAIAFIISGGRDPVTMLLGAGSIGILTTFLIEWVHRSGRVQADASIGIVFTALFAVGVVLISAKAGMVDLDQDCVLYGEIAYAPWDTLIVGGKSWGIRPLWILSTVTIINVVFAALFFKELKISTFDPALATALGFSATLLHYSLMSLVSLTTVAAFESVGAILVIAMFVVPAATAYLLTDKLSTMMIIVVFLAALISLSGYAMARMLDASIAGSLTTAAGFFFLLAFLFSPLHGVIPRAMIRFGLTIRIAMEDWLANAYRIREKGVHEYLDPDASRLSNSRIIPILLKYKGLVSRIKSEWKLTESGLVRAGEIVMRHRNWEGFLNQEWNIPADHLHRPAHDAEHYLDEDIINAQSPVEDMKNRSEG